MRGGSTTFDLTASLEEAQTCCNGDCTGSPADTRHELSYTTSCDMEGMAADWGEVAFCSYRCAREFANLGALQTTNPREDLIVFTGQPVLVHLTRKGDPEPLRSVLGFDAADARRKANEMLENDGTWMDIDVEDVVLTHERL